MCLFLAQFNDWNGYVILVTGEGGREKCGEGHKTRSNLVTFQVNVKTRYHGANIAHLH
jgi:hypothetical protein